MNLKKCEFVVDNASYMGYGLKSEGILPGSDALKAVQDSEPPKQFIKTNSSWDSVFFRSQFRNFAQIVSPLHKLTSKETKWKNGELTAINTLKQPLCSEPVVDYPGQALLFNCGCIYRQ
jgi:hypothetical protein